MIKRKYEGQELVTEYENPPLIPGEEYRTTERIHGKAVYKRANADGGIEYRLDGETEWKLYTAPMNNVSMNLLWVNDKPSENFGAKTIELDLSGYDAVFMLVGSTTTWRALINSFAPVGDILLVVDGTKYRSAQTSTTGLVFTDAYNVSSLSNNSLIPYMIYGIKGVVNTISN